MKLISRLTLASVLLLSSAAFADGSAPSLGDLTFFPAQGQLINTLSATNDVKTNSIEDLTTGSTDLYTQNTFTLADTLEFAFMNRNELSLKVGYHYKTISAQTNAITAVGSSSQDDFDNPEVGYKIRLSGDGKSSMNIDAGASYSPDVVKRRGAAVSFMLLGYDIGYTSGQKAQAYVTLSGKAGTGFSYALTPTLNYFGEQKEKGYDTKIKSYMNYGADFDTQFVVHPMVSMDAGASFYYVPKIKAENQGQDGDLALSHQTFGLNVGAHFSFVPNRMVGFVRYDYQESSKYNRENNLYSIAPKGHAFSGGLQIAM